MKRKRIRIPRKLKAELKKIAKSVRNVIQFSEGDWMIRQYEDYFMGSWYGNEELWYKGTMQHHATLTDLMTPEQLPDRMHELIRINEELNKRYLEKLNDR